MNDSSVNCPKWIADQIVNSGGSVSFHQYMDWALNDPNHGAYACGHLEIGPKGDFVTSPSLGPDFAELLAVQLVDWFHQLHSKNIHHLPLTLIEVGPGDGSLAFELVQIIGRLSPFIFNKLELVLIEINQGMIQRQKERLKTISSIPIRWLSLEELNRNPVIGIILAHEMLDALPVERIILKEKKLYRQGVKLNTDNSHSSLSYTELPLSHSLESYLVDIVDRIGIKVPPDGAPNGWSTELHTELITWLNKASNSLIYGSLLIIDYAMEGLRYYSSRRDSGTTVAYRKQVASMNLLEETGYWDLTSHLCIDTLIYYAKKYNWHHLGNVRQGQALLALGLSERLNSLQQLSINDLGIALSRREGLLRLVDPVLLGEFRWLAFQINNNIKSKDELEEFTTLFLSESPG